MGGLAVPVTTLTTAVTCITYSTASLSYWPHC